MSDKYAYSLNGEHYRGVFSSRDEAIAEALAAAKRSDNTPQSVFVGRMVPASPKADGHARAVLSHMGARAREEFGDAASNYLAHLTKPQIEQLDDALEVVVLGWLQQNDLLPNFFKVEAIGEIPVPSSASSIATQEVREVQEIGSGEYET